MKQRILLPAYRLLLRTGRTPLRRVWLAGYRLAAWLAATYLMHGERGDATYLRAGLASGDFVPGLSDIDLLLVCDPDPGAPGAAARRIHARHQRLTTASRAVELLLDRPLVFEADELPDVTGANTSTFGLRRPATRGNAWLSTPTAPLESITSG